MRTKNFLKHLFLGALMLTTGKVVGQTTVGSNMAGATTNFLGWDNTFPANNFPLRVRHDLNQPIEWYTDAIQRMLLAPTITGQTVNGYGAVDLSGYLGIGPFGNASVNQPQAMLHLDGGGNEDSGWRPWMKQGTYITYTTDQAYLGLKAESGDRNHLTLAWSDNGLLGEPDCPDQLRFIFTRDNVGTTLAAGIHGLEAGRFTPATSCNEVFFGLGHWQGTGLNPVDRLHLLNGRIRVTQLPTDAPANAMTKVLVVDDSFTPEYGVIKWRDISTLQDCDWEVTATDDVVTAWQPGPISGCPDESNMVGIGMPEPGAKLDVLKTRNTGLAEDIAIRAQNDVVGGTKVSADLINVQEGIQNFGLRSAVDGASRNWGVSSLTGAGVWSGSVVSGYFFADGEYITQDPIAVWGSAVRDMSGGPGWAAWFDGYGYLSLGPWVTSDATLKQNIEPLNGCLDVVEQLAPKSYEFAAQDHPEMNLPTGYQAGVLAQDLQQVLPHLVREAHRPEVTDPSGNVISAAADLLTVNYEGIIPYLIGAIHELKATNDAQQAQISTLQQDLATCCAAHGSTDGRGMSPGAGARLRQGFGDANAGAGEALRTDLFIVPNPVADHTQLRYTVATPGRTRLEVSDASGKRLEVLEEAVREAGAYTHDWTTTDLAPGTYHVTLYLNDSFVVKKAVKVAR